MSKPRCLKSIVVMLMLSPQINAEWRFSLNGGISVHNSKTAHVFDFGRSLKELRKVIDEQTKNLIDGNDFTSIKECQDNHVNIDEDSELGDLEKVVLHSAILNESKTSIGFGVKDPDDAEPRDFSSIETKINKTLKTLREKVVELFPSTEFEISSTPEFFVYREPLDNNGKLYYGKCILRPTFITSLKYPEFNSPRESDGMRILNGSTEDIELPYYVFFSEDTLRSAFLHYIEPNYDGLLADWNKISSPKAVHRAGLTLGMSAAYSHTFFPKKSSKYGFYCGVEGFAEITPHAVKSSSFRIREKEFGIRAFFGIEARDSWRIFAIVGAKRSMKNVSVPPVGIWPNEGSGGLSGKCSKVALELGLGSEYLISNKFSVGFRVIKTLKTNPKVQNLKLNTSSVKFMLSFSYRF